MAENRQRKIRKKQEGNELNIIISFFVWLVFAISVFFKAQTGFLGSIFGGLIYRLFGLASPAAVILAALILLALFYQRLRGKLLRTVLYSSGLFICILMIISINDLPRGTFKTTMEMALERGAIGRGAGLLGGLFAYVFINFFGKVGLYILTAILAFFFGLELFDVAFSDFLKAAGSVIIKIFTKLKEQILSFIADTKEKRKKKAGGDFRPIKNRDFKDETYKPESDLRFGAIEDSSFDRPEEIDIQNYFNNNQPADEEELPLNHDLDKRTIGEKKSEEGKKSSDNLIEIDQEDDELDKALLENSEDLTYISPPIDLLKSSLSKNKVSESQLTERAKVIEKTLESFGIESRVVSIKRGPTVTQFELKPQAGVKVSRITNLSDDLALALAASDIRIEAPIPGKPYVGVEVPNKEADTVALRDILQSQEFLSSSDDLPVALGQSIEGDPVIAKIAKMPHLLIAGATGSGKSVCINTIIISLIYRYAPWELKLLLVDPKLVELSVYNDIPHLLAPVVTDPKKAARALQSLVKEMERRFQIFSSYGVRDIAGYREERISNESMEPMPYIVLIIDELSDLMMVASKDVESYITRLAQMARACGIHLIIATQRPSVDVITGTIKANIPSRISFQVSSSIDSRTILDQTGAEKLLGKGDMLYYPASFPKPKRVQATFVSDKEVGDVVSFLTDRHQVHYDPSLIKNIEKENEVSGIGEDDSEKDPLMDEVLDFIKNEETTSISGLQRRFRIGYARAGRIIDDLELLGAISAQDGSKPRQVYLKDEGAEDEPS